MFILCLLYKTIFQFIVVGAGSAGCVLANRLTADGTKKVLLLEAGGLEGAAVQVPFFSPLLQRTKIDWDYTSEPQQEASLSVDGRINRFPRGKVFGGSSSINHVIYSRGNRKDFDNWASLYGAEGWSYKDVLPDFIKIETSYLGIDNDVCGIKKILPFPGPFQEDATGRRVRFRDFGHGPAMQSARTDT
ncbi:hypothetical protein MRX96_019741 [Rhipicephalus microplus]